MHWKAGSKGYNLYVLPLFQIQTVARSKRTVIQTESKIKAGSEDYILISTQTRGSEAVISSDDVDQSEIREALLVTGFAYK